MGYQESIIRVKKKDQTEFIKQIINSDRDKYIFCDPCFIVEVKKDIEKFNFEKDDKLVYVCGERDGQRDLKDFIYNSDNQIKIDSNVENKIYPIEDLEDSSLFELLENEFENGYSENEDFKIIELDQYIKDFKKQQEQNVNKYIELKEKHRKRFNDFSIGFAFNNEQFKKMMNNWGLKESDTDKICSIGANGFIRKTDLKAFEKMYYEIKKERDESIEKDKTGDGYIKDMFLYELNNHEYGYTGDVEETLETLGFSYEDIENNLNLKHGLELAKKEIWEQEKEQEEDYDL